MENQVIQPNRKNALELLRSAFGSYVALPYPLSRADKARVEILDKYKMGTLQESEALKTSVMGTPIFMPCTIDGYDMPNEPLIEIAGSKSIVKTDLAGYAGTVKEDMGMDDYAILIRGVVTNDDAEEFPVDAIRRLRELCEKREGLSISSPILRLFNINQIVIENWRFPAVAGELSVQAYEFQCLSDFDPELIIQDAIL